MTVRMIEAIEEVATVETGLIGKKFAFGSGSLHQRITRRYELIVER